jgi:integrase/recombinase XerD
MNSRQGSRYIKRRMDNELKEKILVHNGIISEKESIRKKSPILNCPRCDLINAFENKYCSKCSYPLKPEAFEEIKISENKKFEVLEEKYENVNNTLQNILAVLDNMEATDKNKMARKLIEKGVYKSIN